MTEAIASKTISKWRKPGFLLEPLTWVPARLSKAMQDEPSLVELLFDIDPARMHLMALALAHIDCDITPELTLMLLKGFRKPILNLSLGSHHPLGIDRALRQLPPKVLPAELYRKLVNLLDDPVTAKFLHHCTLIKEATLTELYGLPIELRRPAILAMFNRVEGMGRFAEGLQFLALRSGITFDVIATQIGSLDQPEQVIAKVRQIVESLSLPEMPPTRVGTFRRLDHVAEIRAIAKNWKNCMTDFLCTINDGTGAFYLSQQSEQPAVCLVVRDGRIGWFLDEVKGPNNVDIEPQYLGQIHEAFANASIPQSFIVEAIKTLSLTKGWSERRNCHDMIADEDEL